MVEFGFFWCGLFFFCLEVDLNENAIFFGTGYNVGDLTVHCFSPAHAVKAT